MSVAAQSPFLGNKRLLEGSDSPDRAGLTHKRLRQHSSSPSTRGGHQRLTEKAYALGCATIAALQGLFPSMDEKTVTAVLDACGDDVNEAIKRLGKLQLAVGDGQAAAKREASTLEAANGHSSKFDAQNSARRQSGAPSSSGDPAEAEVSQSAQVRSSAEWVELMVQQMSEARSLDDARQRASRVFVAAEQAILQSAAAKKQQGVGDPKLAELMKENSLLKRAVAIQQSRWQESVASKDSEIGQLQQHLQQLQAKVHSLEVSNYSLNLHLKQLEATSSARSFMSHNHPDVF